MSSHVSRVPRRRQGARSSTFTRDLCDVDVVHLAAVRAAMAALPAGDVVARVADVLGLLGNPTRLNILWALHSRRADQAMELCVCDLAIVARASKSMTSHQLRLLRTAGLVRQRRAGKLMYYRLADGPLCVVLNDLMSLASAGNGAVALKNSARNSVAVTRRRLRRRAG